LVVTERTLDTAGIEAEQALLGILMMSPETVFEVEGEVTEARFAEPFHQRLYALVRDHAQKGRAADPALLRSRFEEDPAFVDLGGASYLGLLVEKAPPIPNVKDYAREVAGAFTRRELQRVGSEIAHLSALAGGDVDELLGEAERLLSEVTASSGAGDRWTSAGVMVRDAISYARERSGTIDYPTGVPALDAHLGGLNAGEVTIGAARPGMGKTVFGQTVAKANANRGLGTCFFSLEMSKNALGLRLASDVAFDRRAAAYSGVTTNATADRAMKNALTPEQWTRFDEAQRVVNDWPLLVDDRPGLTLAQIESAARRAHRRWARRGIKPGPVVIDHLGKVKPSVDRKGNRHAEVADLSAGASEMAKRLMVPVLALVQLNRGVEGREDKRPQLSDLRQAGELEEDARQVLFIYRPEYYLREPTGNESFEEQTERVEQLRKVENQMFFLVEKNSHGPRGQVKAFCDIACSAIRDWEA
jgi:replicative DNA helicase